MRKHYLFSIFLSFFIITATSCTTEYSLATNKQETFLYGDDKEIKIGDAAAAGIEKSYEFNTDVDVNQRVQKILDNIVEVSDRKDIVYFIKIINEKHLNAVSLPGGYIYIFQGLLEAVDNDDQLAGVIAHEVAHITARHGIKRLQSAYGAMLLQIASTQTNARVYDGLNFALNSLFMEYSQEAEYESDRLSVKYLKKAGYDPKEMINLLDKLKEEQEKAPIRPYSYWRTHPNPSRRKAVVNQEINGRLEFRDYLQLIDDEEK